MKTHHEQSFKKSYSSIEINLIVKLFLKMSLIS